MKQIVQLKLRQIITNWKIDFEEVVDIYKETS